MSRVLHAGNGAGMNQGEMSNPRDHEIVGIFVSVLLTVGLPVLVLC